MSATIRLMGTREECEIMYQAIDFVMTVRSVSKFYPNRGKSIEGRVYVEVDINDSL